MIGSGTIGGSPKKTFESPSHGVASGHLLRRELNSWVTDSPHSSAGPLIRLSLEVGSDVAETTERASQRRSDR